jgi:uncharacterized membrane protein
VLFETILVAAAVSGAIGYRQLKTRIDTLDSKLKALEFQKLPAAARVISPLPPAAPEVKREVSPGSAHSLVSEATPERNVAPLVNVAQDRVRVVKPAQGPSPWSQATESVVGMVKSNPFASLGVLLVLVGVGFLFSLLAASNILPPVVRVLLVALAGAGAFAFGLKQEKVRPSLAMNLQGGALAAEFLCVLWAYQVYGLVSTPAAFAWMGGLSTLAVGWAAYKKRGLLALMGIAGSLLTPIVASTGSGVFSGLVLYCTWITALGLGVGVYLGIPSLVSATLAGVSALLGAAMGLSRGAQGVSLMALLTLLASYSGVALYWSRKQFDWAARQQASLVAVLLGAPLIMTGMMGAMAGLSAKSCAMVLGVTALVYLGSLVRASDAWKAWLLSIGSGLGIIALGVGLEGASRALAFSATALSLVMVARAIGKPWAGLAAFAYWVLSVLLGAAALKDGFTLPLLISGLVALGAGFVSRGHLLGAVYAVLAPVVLFVAIFHEAGVPTYAQLTWFLAWGAGALAAGKYLNWSGIRLSACWVLPAGLALLVDPAFAQAGLELAAREVVLGAWLVLSAFLVWAYSEDKVLTWFKPSLDNVGKLTLLLPILISYELHNFTRNFGLTESIFGAMLTLLWSGWCAAALVTSRKFNFDFKAFPAGVVGAGLLSANLLFSEPGLFLEIAQWVSIGLLVFTARNTVTPAKRKLVLATYGLAGGVLVGTLLRAIGEAYGRHYSTIELLFTRVMQPWVSLLWAAAGIAVVVYASGNHSRKMWMGGGIAIVVLMLKMLLIDLSTFSLAAKVGVFMVIGVAFIALGRYSPVPPDKAAETP